ncbi:MAG: gamma-glutamylcyclotransferase [Albidovulum sp.]|nr:gamma-glutamylcyclotransferase [Albidovulum sp.]MDE0534070.1 gamma-glutamylcyclotransferase [Albidovulum sp.]
MPESGFWVFGYGSLLWNPGFAPAEQMRARLRGYCRCFCMRSFHHRGNREWPGLVLALDKRSGAHCDGLALRASPKDADGALRDLRERELISDAYIETHVRLELSGGGEATALAFVVDPGHEQYCGVLPIEEQARIIASARGGKGKNSEYLFKTCESLSHLGISDPVLDELARRVRSLTGD